MTKRILVIEDEPQMLLGLRDNLELEGYEVVTASDGEDGLAKAISTAPDLVILDVTLPRKNGFEVCRELRRSGVHTPIILLTARAQEAEKVLGLQLGADDYVTKPFSPMELLARVQAVLRRASGLAAPDIFRFNDMEVDFGRCELRRAGRRVELTAVEFKLLAAFVQRRGRVLTREQILDAVWTDATCSDRVVDTHVANLRKKIEKNPSEPEYLFSVRGMGYRFDG